jgi:hypothetical protein
MTSDTIIKFFLIYLKKEKRSPSLPKKYKSLPDSQIHFILKTTTDWIVKVQL